MPCRCSSCCATFSSNAFELNLVFSINPTRKPFSSLGRGAKCTSCPSGLAVGSISFMWGSFLGCGSKRKAGLGGCGRFEQGGVQLEAAIRFEGDMPGDAFGHRGLHGADG